MSRFILLFIFGLSLSSCSPCSSRSFGVNKTVCVCNSTFCDEIEPIGTLKNGQAALYQSTKSGQRMVRTLLTSTTDAANKVRISVNEKKLYQTFKGFGAAFTDSAGINMMSLPSNIRETILRQYFSPDGLGYTIGRVPIASCDFSTHEYSYNEVAGDLAMDHFNLTDEDFNYKIPFIKRAQQWSNNQLKLFATPWSAPGWMKTNNDMKGGGLLDGPIDGDYYTSWATYIVKFFEQYYAQGISFWGLTAQNEPTTGRDKNYHWQTMFFNASMQRDFIKTLLGPKLVTNPVTQNIELMIMDDQRFNLPHWPTVVLSDNSAAQYVSGIALHWYEDAEVPPDVMLETHNKWPNHFMLATEACTGYIDNVVALGDWYRGELYAHDIIVDFQNWVTGWTDWNYCLDLKGGPNWVGNTVDAPIIVNATAQEYYKQPMFYALAHFSKFLVPGTIRCDTELLNYPLKGLEHLPFVDPQGRKGVVILNTSEKEFDISVSDYNVQKRWFNFKMEAKSLFTVVFP